MLMLLRDRLRVALIACVVLSVMPWGVMTATAADATPPADPPVQVEEPEATEAPAEPTATEAPAEPTATTAVPTETSVPTATQETAESELGAAAIPGFRAVFLICEDAGRAGESEMHYFTGDFGAASTGDCHTADVLYPGTSVTITLSNADNTYTFDVTFGEDALTYTIEDGTYTVSYSGSDSTEIPGATLPDTIVVSSADIQAQAVVRYFIAPQSDPAPAEGFVYLEGTHYSCRDASRDGQSDFFLGGLGAASADQCAPPSTYGAAEITIEGTTAAGAPFGPDTVDVESGGWFYFGQIPTGTYTVTESVYGNSAVIELDAAEFSGSVYLNIYNYYATEPVYNVDISAQLYVCYDPARAGTVDYNVVQVSDFVAVSSCVESNDIELDDALELTLFDDENTTVASAPVQYSHDHLDAYGVSSGTYTIQLESYPASSAFTVDAASYAFVDVIVYVDEAPELEVPGEGFGWIDGGVTYCISEELNGTVNYVIEAEFVAEASADCTVGPRTSGQLFVEQVTSPEDPTVLESFTLPVMGGEYSSDELPAGYYRVGFATDAFSEPLAWSDVFGVYNGEDTEVVVYVYTAEPANAFLLIRKDICFSDEKAGTTEFFFQQEPIGEFFATDETNTCTIATILDGTYTFTLTHVESGESVSTSTDILPIAITMLPGVPAGEYTLTEEVGGLSKTSEPFVLDPAGGDYSVLVRNFKTGELPEGESEAGIVMVWAYDCINDEKAGTSSFYYYPGTINIGGEFPGGEFPGGIQGPLGSEISGAAEGDSNEFCVPAGSYEFVLDGGPEIPTGVSAQAVYPLVQGPAGQNYIHVSSFDGTAPSPLPAGTYVLRETSTGFVSDPITITQPFNISAFYRFQAAPTPTPEPTETPDPTETPEPTATATLEPGVTPTVDPGDGNVGPGGDPDANATATAQAGGGDDGDGDGSDSDDPGTVTQLPSTGQGEGSATSATWPLLALAGLALVLLGASIRRKTAR